MSVITACYLTLLVVGLFSGAAFTEAPQGSLAEKLFHAVFVGCVWAMFVLVLVHIWSSVK